jgi:hypothetical protein
MMVRLAWHSAGSFKKADGSGGTDGATIRFEPEINYGGLYGLDLSRSRCLSLSHAACGAGARFSRNPTAIRGHSSVALGQRPLYPYYIPVQYDNIHTIYCGGMEKQPPIPTRATQ